MVHLLKDGNMEECKLEKSRKGFKFMSSKNSIKKIGLVDEKSNWWRACNHWTILVEVGVEARDVRVPTTQTYSLACSEVKQDDHVVVRWNPKGGCTFWREPISRLRSKKCFIHGINVSLEVPLDHLKKMPQMHGLFMFSHSLSKREEKASLWEQKNKCQTMTFERPWANQFKGKQKTNEINHCHMWVLQNLWCPSLK